jgi:RNA polymerase sigma factor (sigma-70 family)
MLASQTNIVLRHIRELAATSTHDQLPDDQLLQRFLVDQSEAAFAALVRRHGPLVLAVCRRTLHNWHDAEDAFQATFLILARRANTIRKQQSLGSWLHGVAYRAAAKIRTQAATRKRHEMQPVSGLAADPLAEVKVRELFEALDEEIQRLPQRLRAPLVLCYLEGRTRDEAAAQLGWSLNTVRRRLEQGRELLRSRLAHRGVTLGAALAVSGLAGETASAAVPSFLTARTVQAVAALATGTSAAAGVFSERVLAVTEAVVGSLRVARTAVTGSLLVAGVLLLGVMSFALARGGLGQVQGSPPGEKAIGKGSQEKGKAEVPIPSPDAERKLTVDGQVHDPAGKPVAKAQVQVLVMPRWDPSPNRPGPAVSAVTTTDAEGRFQLTLAYSAAMKIHDIYAVAMAPGHGLGWEELEGGPAKVKTTIRLRPESVIRGRVLDLQGQPAAKVGIYLARMATLKQEHYLWGIAGLQIWPKSVTTDAEGRFVLRGIGKDLKASLRIGDDRFERKEFEASTAEPRAELNVVLGPARRLEGQITCEKTGKPIPRAYLTLWAMSYQGSEDGGAVDGLTDEKGRFQLQPYGGPHLEIYVHPPKDAPNLGLIKTLTWPKGKVKETLNIQLPEGILVSGRLTEEPSGKAVAGARITFGPEYVPALNREVLFGGSGWHVESGKDGKFQIAVPPVPGQLLIQGPSRDYISLLLYHDVVTGKISKEGSGFPRYTNASARLELKSGAKPPEVKLALRRGVTIPLRIVGPDDKPLTHVWLMARPQLSPGGKEILGPDGRFELRGCDPKEAQSVFILDRKNKAGAARKISAKDAGKEPLTIKLAPCGSATMRFVNKEGKAVVGRKPMAFQLIIVPGSDPGPNSRGKGLTIADAIGVQAPSTDDQGCITFTDLIPGATYRILGAIGASYGTLRDFTAVAGKTLELPDLVLER